MFGDYVLKQTAAEYNRQILIIDDYELDETTHYSRSFQAQGFTVVHYTDDLNFRIEYENTIKNSDDRIVVIANSANYIPFDIQQYFKVNILSLDRLFPKLNTDTLKLYGNIDMDLLCLAYQKNFDDLRQSKQTEEFLQKE